MQILHIYPRIYIYGMSVHSLNTWQWYFLLPWTRTRSEQCYIYSDVRLISLKMASFEVASCQQWIVIDKTFITATAHSVVFSAQCKNMLSGHKQKLAIKQYLKRIRDGRRLNPSQFHEDLQILECLRPHPHIVELFGVNKQQCELFLEFCPFTLLTVPKRTLQENKHEFLLSCLDGLAYLHEQNVMHGDIKPENILVSSNDVIKLCDFSHSVCSLESYIDCNLVNCTAPYLLPDAYMSSHVCKTDVDTWALGIVILTIFMNKQVYSIDLKTAFADKHLRLLKPYVRAQYYASIKVHMEECTSPLKHMLSEEKSQRLNARDLHMCFYSFIYNADVTG